MESHGVSKLEGVEGMEGEKEQNSGSSKAG